MDIERDTRKRLIKALGSDFLCFEEVELRPALFPRFKLRADVVAVPIEEEFWPQTLAFEVKSFADDRDYGKWSSAIKQASDYVYSSLSTQGASSALHHRRISASFVYPAPIYMPNVPRTTDYASFGPYIMISGAFHSALQFRVGRAWHDQRLGSAELILSMGPNEVWRETKGFSGQARGLLTGKRKLGSNQVDVLAELDGIGHAHLPYPQFE